MLVERLLGHFRPCRLRDRHAVRRRVRRISCTFNCSLERDFHGTSNEHTCTSADGNSACDCSRYCQSDQRTDSKPDLLTTINPEHNS